MTTRHPLLRKKDIEALPEEARPHPLDSSLVRHTRSLGDAVGLTRMGVHLVRLRKGATSSVYHRHYQDEEWVYVLSGRAVADIGGEKHEVGPGDFMGFPGGSPAHNLHNPHDEEFVYLVAGDHSQFDICDYPRHGKRRYRIDGKNVYVDADVVSQAGDSSFTSEKGGT